ncbi:MAG: MobA/MobL family protein, partial [Lachnospiraceae bacterium]|nr:MobA/MobL family protein [Lachnospiraceae bacterium]
FHCQIKIISRGKGKTATAAAAYRSGTKIVDDEFGETHDYTRKGGVVFSEILLCVNAPSKYSDRQTLWNEVQKIEKQKNAQLCREVEVALPIEFPRDEQIEVVREYIKKNFTDKGMIADWSLHDKSDGNPHAHILLTMRPLKQNGEWGAKRKDSYALDDNGNRIPVIDPKTGKQKIGARGRKMWERISIQSTDWNDQTKAEEWRKSWADICNEHLKGQAHIDHRSYARQGKEQLPMLHESYAARKIVKRGGYSYIIEYNEQVRKFNRERELIDKGIAEVQNELKQLEQEKDDIQKGQKKNEFNRRIADLLERRSRTVNQSGERVTNGERTVQADKQQTGTTDTDALIRQTKAVNDSARAELANTRLDSEQSKSERTNIADKSGKQTNEEKRRRNRH